MNDEVSIFGRCAACGEALNEDVQASGDERAPCPKCGSTARHISLEAHMTITITATAELTVIPYSQALLDEAQDLHSMGKYGLAVVVAHTACEVAVERALAAAIQWNGVPEYLRKFILPNKTGYNITQSRIQELFETLFGVKLGKEPFWKDLSESVKRRNMIVHTGQAATHDDSGRSLQAATALVLYVQEQQEKCG